MARNRTDRAARPLGLALVATLVVGAAAPAAAGDRIVVADEAVAEWENDAAWIVAGQALDAGTTVWALERNASLREGNPFLADRSSMLLVKSAYTLGAVVACRELRKRGHPGKARWLSRAVFAFGVVLAANAIVRGTGQPGR